jgi:threonyl-tRNA synthetase
MEDRKEKLEIKRHSASHVLAAAFLEMFPEAKLGVGPAIEDGFYYDFEIPRTLIPEDLEILEGKMREIIKKNLPFEREEIEIEKAIELFKKAKQDYKVELLEDLKKLKEKKVSVYRTGNFVDLCKGPHIDSSLELDFKALKLDRIAGAYWKGDEKRKMLQRVYGLYFNNAKDLKKYEKEREEKRKNDHRKIGKELDLFYVDEMVGKGLPMLTPRGAVIRRELERFIVDEELKRGYQHVYTPVLGKLDMYKTSTHWDHYRDSMYAPIKIDGEEFILRPMTCPHHFRLFQRKINSYKDLPIRMAEISPLFRYEQSGELSGLIRLRGFTLSDAHIFCRLDQVKEEFEKVLDLIEYVTKTFDLKDYWYRLSLRDEKDKKKYAGDAEIWDKSEKILKEIVKERKMKCDVKEGEAAFYGPKIDVQIRNVNGKEDTIITNQIDFYLPKKFKTFYVNEKGQEEQPVVIHRSSIGAIERTMAFLIEKFGGNFPVWLSPVQVKVLTISEKFLDYSKKVKENLERMRIRVEEDNSDESLGKKVRKAEKEKVPYMLILGEKEEQNKTVNVRERGSKEQKEKTLEEFSKEVLRKISKRV